MVPVGVVWIDISKEHYGLHGTPEPSQVGRTESHGCVRLTNWDALRVAALVKPGTRVRLCRMRARDRWRTSAPAPHRGLAARPALVRGRGRLRIPRRGAARRDGPLAVPLDRAAVDARQAAVRQWRQSIPAPGESKPRRPAATAGRTIVPAAASVPPRSEGVIGPVPSSPGRPRGSQPAHSRGGRGRERAHPPVLGRAGRVETSRSHRHPGPAQYSGAGGRGRHDRPAVLQQGRRDHDLPVRPVRRLLLLLRPPRALRRRSPRGADRSERARSSATSALRAMPRKTRLTCTLRSSG